MSPHRPLLLTFCLLAVCAWAPTAAVRAEEASAGAVVEGITRYAGVPRAMRIEIRRLPVEVSCVPLFHEARRRVRDVDWLSPGIVEGEPLLAAQSDERGRYRIPGLARGHYEVRAVASEFHRAFAPLTVRGEGGAYLVDLGAAPGPLPLAGRARYRDGRPFVGWLVLTQEAEGRRAWPWLHGGDALRTDAEGRFEAHGLVESPVEITAVLPGRLRVLSARFDHPPAAPVDLVVDADLSAVEAVVVNAEGRPVSGARVVLRSGSVRGSRTHASAWANAEGRLSLQRAPGPLEALVLDPALDRTATVLEGTPLVLRAARAARISGIVRHAEQGTPVPGAWVHLTGNDGQYFPEVAVTDAEGRYEFERVRADPFLLYVAGGGWIDAAPESLGTPRTLGRETSLDAPLLAIPYRKTATLRVVDQQGAPCPAVEVWVRWGHLPGYLPGAERLVLESPAPEVTDAKGRCRIVPPRPDFWFGVLLAHPRLVARKHGGPWRIPPGGALRVQIHQAEGVAGRVALPERVPPRRVRLTVRPGFGPRVPPRAFVARPDGSFRLGPAIWGRSRVRASTWQGDTYLAGEVWLERGKPEPVLTMVRAVPRGAWLLHVQGPEGEPVAAGWATRAHRDLRGGATGGVPIERGRLFLESLAQYPRPMSVTLYAMCDAAGHPLPYRNRRVGPLRPGVHTIRLEVGRTLLVRVIGRNGAPLEKVDVHARMVDRESEPGARAFTGADGVAVLSGLGVGAVTVQVGHVMHHVDSTPVEVAAGVDETTVALVPFVAAQLLVTDEAGTPVEGARVCASSAVRGATAFRESGALRLETGTEGRCRLPSLAPEIRIDLSIEPSDPYLLPMALSSWTPKDEAFVLRRAHVLRGRVVSPDGDPVPDATVWMRAHGGTPALRQHGLAWWRDPEGFVLSATTDPEGAFVVEQLPPGTLDVKAAHTHDDGTLRTSSTIVAETGAGDVTLKLSAD